MGGRVLSAWHQVGWHWVRACWAGIQLACWALSLWQVSMLWQQPRAEQQVASPPPESSPPVQISANVADTVLDWHMVCQVFVHCDMVGMA